MKIMTLCEECRSLFADAYSVKPYKMQNSTTKPGNQCEKCGKKVRVPEMFIIDRKER